MYKILFISFSLLLSTNTLLAQDTASTYPVAYADTTKLEIAPIDPFLFPSQNKSLMKALFLNPNELFHSYDPYQLMPVPKLFENNYNSYENKLFSTQRVGQSIMLNMEQYQRNSEIFGTIGLIMGVAAWGAVGYQMFHPQQNPNLRPEGPAPKQAPTPKGNPRPMR